MSMPTIPEGKYRPTLQETVIDLLESIALEEIALSHLINSEAEKNQAFVEKINCHKSAVSNCEIEKYSESVRKMIDTVVMKEWILLKKLETVLEIDCGHDEHHCCKDKCNHDHECHHKHKDDCDHDHECHDHCKDDCLHHECHDDCKDNCDHDHECHDHCKDDHNHYKYCKVRTCKCRCVFSKCYDNDGYRFNKYKCEH